MLFHSLAGSEMHGVIDEMDRRAKGDAPVISSAIDRGETETVGRAHEACPERRLGKGGGGRSVGLQRRVGSGLAENHDHPQPQPQPNALKSPRPKRRKK